MADLRKMTVERLRALARHLLGNKAARLRGRASFIEALLSLGPGALAAATRTGRKGAGKAKKGAGAVRGAARPPPRNLGRGEAQEVGVPPKRRGRKAKAGAAQALGAGVGPLRSRRSKARGQGPARSPPTTAVEVAEGATDPAGFFVARVRGEEAVREAPHPMAEGASDTGVRVPEGVPLAPPVDEGLGELPWTYDEDRLVALPRDPRSLFLYWDLARSTQEQAFAGLDHPRAQLWVFATEGEGFVRVRAVELALESRGFYLHDLEPGRRYRAELHAVDRSGRETLLGASSNEVALPPAGASAVVDDLFRRLPWEEPLGPSRGKGHPGRPFPEWAREALARLSRAAGVTLALAGSGGRARASPGGTASRPSPPHLAEAPDSVPGGRHGKGEP